MEKGYFAAAWGDITKSPGWISKLLRLGLLCLVPIFGQVVLYGYLYAWARDIAWNVHRPLPDKIFGNEDGNLYKRGFFIFLIMLVFSLVPGVFNLASQLVSGTAVAGGALGVTMSGAYYSYAPVMGGLFFSMLFALVAFILAFAVCFFAWVGSMRTALYGTLSAGFQLNKIWAMLRYDFTGLLRIFAMALIVGLITGFVLSVSMLMFVLVAFIAAMAASLSSFSVVLLGVGAFCLLLGVAFLLFSIFCIALCEALIVRALGYWTRQFEVNRWGGQEDPMPFEQRFAGQQPSIPQQPGGQPGAGANYQQPASYDAPGSVPVQAAPYQVAQQPVSRAPFQEAPAAVVHQADSPATVSDVPAAASGAPVAESGEPASDSTAASDASATASDGTAEPSVPASHSAGAPDALEGDPSQDAASK